MLTTAILLSSLAMPAAADVASVSADSKAPVVLVAEEELSPIDIYFPFMPDPILDQTPLEPEVAENIWVLLIVGVALGPINAFIPTLIVGDTVQVHEDFMMEQLIGGLIKIPFYYFFGLGAYLNAIGYVQTLDRNIKKTRGKPPAKWAADEVVGAPVSAMAF
jgi:hypothetical protein